MPFYVNITLVSLGPVFDITHKAPSNALFHVMFDEKFWVLIFVDLLKVQIIFQCDIASSPEFNLQYLIVDFRLLPVTVFVYSYVSETGNIETMGRDSICQCI